MAEIQGGCPSCIAYAVLMQIAVFHPGTQHSWQTALALQQLDRLAWYATSIFYKPDEFPYRLERMLPGAIGRKLHQEFSRFSHTGLDPALVRTAGLTEWLERIAHRANFRSMARQLDRFGNKRFVFAIAETLRSSDRFAMWGFNGSSLSTFALAKEYGRICLLDRTIGDARAYNSGMAALQASHGEWFLETERSIPEASIHNDQREYELADAILVGSEFAANTIRQAAGPAAAAKIRILPYCYDEALFAALPPPRPVPRNGPLKFLFVGQVNPRKGIHHILEAIARIPPTAATLTIVGDLRIPREIFARYADRVDYRPTVPRSAIPSIMAEHHVLVFPSYFEGSALSLLEGLAAGLGIIQTVASGNGATAASGVVLEEPKFDALFAAMMVAIENRDLVDSWRTAAQSEAHNYSFTRYRDNIAELLKELVV